MPAIHIDILSRLDESSAEDVSRGLERHFERTGERIGGVLGEAIKRRLEQADVGEGVIKNFERMQQAAEKAGAAIGASLVGGISAAAIGLEKIGDTFENIHRQLTLTTDASGAAFDNLNSRANALVGTLDTAANNVGRDFGLMASRVRDTGPELEKLVGHVEMLRDRFQGLDVNALASEFSQFGVVGAAKADEALASLTQSAISANISLSSLVATIGPEAATFHQAGFNIEQAGAAIAALERDGVPAQKAVSGLEVAMKAMDEAIKNGRGNWPSFQAFMQDVSASVNNLLNAGRIGDAQRLMEEVTGQRRWAEAMPLIQRFNEILANPDGYRAQAGYLDDLQKRTANLHNEWQKLKNQMIVTLEPIAAEWIETLIGKLHEFGEWAQNHQEDLKNLFKGAAEIAGTVITVLEKITELLGQHPALIQAVVVAFAAWETISGVAALIRDLTTIRTLLLAISGAEVAAGASGVGSAIAGIGTAAAAALGPVAALAAALGAVAWGFQWATGPPDLTRLPSGALPNVPAPGGAAKPGLLPGAGQPTLPTEHGIPTIGGIPMPGALPGAGSPPAAPAQPAPPAAPAPPPPGAPSLPPGAGGLEPGFEDKLKGARGGARGGGGKLPEAPELPYGPGFGGPPQPGESEQQYRNRQEILEKQHQLAQDEARVDQLEKAGVQDQDAIQKAKNKVAHDQEELNNLELRINSEHAKNLRQHSAEMEDIGAKIDKDFGISKGLPGIAENLTKFLANLAFAPVFGALGGVSAAASPTGIQGAGKGIIGMMAAGGAFGQQFMPGPEGYGGGGQASRASLSGADLSSPEGILAGGGRVRTLFALANALTGTPYSMPLRNDCSGMVSQLVDAAVGLPMGGPRFSTANEAAALTARGFLPGKGGLGDMTVGWNAGHTAATLPGGYGAETGEGPAGTFGIGGPGAFQPQFTQFMHYPMLGYDSGGAVPIIAHGGEWVIQKSAVDHYGAGFMAAVNSRSYDDGGEVSPFAALGTTQIGRSAPPASYGGGSAGGSGGLIGAGMQAAMGGAAAGAGAGVATMGIGIAAQIAAEEIQRGIQYGGALAGIGMGALQQTFGLGQSKLAQSGWFSKIAGGLVGATPQLPNMAGMMANQAQGGGGVQGDVNNGVQITNFHNYGTADQASGDLTRHLSASSFPASQTGSR